MKNNYFYSLPEDLQEYILEIRNNNCANLIIKNWYRYIDKKIIATRLILDITEYLNLTLFIDFKKTYTLNVLNYCNKILSGRENYWWINKINTINNWLNSVYIPIYLTQDLENPEQKNIINSREILKILKTKFKICIE